jgi:ribosomal protein S18 acetylase RimI-like enzyme
MENQRGQHSLGTDALKKPSLILLINFAARREEFRDNSQRDCVSIIDVGSRLESGKDLLTSSCSLRDPLPTFRTEAHSEVRSAADLAATLELFMAYAAALGIDLGFQDFATELATLPGKYAAPAGELLLARDLHSEPLGCVGVRPIEPDGCCEMKRLYVSPKVRGMRLGSALVDAIVGEAVRIGYREMRLDTLPTMYAAIAL